MVACTSLWAAWFVRNKRCLENATVDPIHTATTMIKNVRDDGVHASKVYGGCSQGVPSSPKWILPMEGWIKINFDAMVKEGVHRGLGVVLRDEIGKVLATGTRIIEGQMNVEMCEAATALFALQLGIRMGVHRAHLEGDAMKVVQTIADSQRGLAPVFLFYDSISVLTCQFLDFLCTHVRRSGNALAHDISTWDTGGAHERVCMEPFPQQLYALAERDLI